MTKSVKQDGILSKIVTLVKADDIIKNNHCTRNYFFQKTTSFTAQV